MLKIVGTLFEGLQRNGMSGLTTEGMIDLPLSRFREELVGRVCQRQMEPHQQSSGHEGRALRYIEQHYTEELSLERVAQALFLSPTYLSRILNEKTQRGFIGWLRYYRIERAKQLLQTTAQKNYEIAESVGYHTYKVFSEQFKE